MASPTTGQRAGRKARTALSDARVVCRLAEPSDLEAITAFCRLAAGVQIPPEYWRWLYFDNPAGRSGIVLALDEGRIVGLMSAFAVPFRLGDQRLLASQMEHNEILRSHRSAGLFFRLANMVVRELIPEGVFDFCFGIAIKETQELSTVLMGFEEVGPIAKLVLAVNPVPHLRKKSKLPLPRLLGRPFAWARRRSAGRGRRGLRVSRFEHFSEVAAIPCRADHAAQLMVARDVDYLEWRYARCPLPLYDKLQVCSDGVPLGFAVCHTFEEQGIRYGVLDECIARIPEALGPVVDSMAGALLDRDVDALVAWSPPATALCRALLGRGFVSRPSQRSLIVRSVSDRVPPSLLASEDSWYYTIGDTEYWLFPTLQGQGRG